MKQKLITAILTLIAIFVPLLIIPSSNNSNYNALKLILLLYLGFALVILLLSRYKNIKLDKKDIIILIFMGLACISTCLSTNIKVSLFGEDNRYEGLLMLIIYICIYICSKKYFKYENISKFLNIMFIVSMTIGVLGIAQKYIKCPELYPIFNKGISGTFGNSNFFGSFISIVLPIAVSIFICNGSKKGFILSLVMFFNMISSGTRSAWVAFAVIGLLWVVYLIKQKNKKYFKRAILILILFVFIFIYLYNGFDFILEKFKTNVENKPSTTNTMNTTDKVAKNKVTTNTTTTIKKEITTTKAKINQITQEIKQAQKTGIFNKIGSGRIEIWKMTLKLICKQPIFGCGPDNLWEGLVKNCKNEVGEYVKRGKITVDKAHNEYLQIAATLGIPALICYLVFIVLILFPKMKLVLSEKIYFILCLGLISYLVQAFFNISTIGVAPIFWMLLGLIDNKDFVERIEKLETDI